MNINSNIKVHNRKNKLIEIHLIFHRADIKIFPDEKVLLKNDSVIHRTDNTDTTDNTDNTDYAKNSKPEFYTALEIKNLIPDYKKANGSSVLEHYFLMGRYLHNINNCCSTAF